jgi:protein involved in polysaccharide export with SLBB domain
MRYDRHPQLFLFAALSIALASAGGCAAFTPRDSQPWEVRLASVAEARGELGARVPPACPIWPSDVLQVEVVKPAATAGITGQYSVRPDGTIELRQYGVVHVAGKRAAEARIALQGHLSQFLDSPELSVEALDYNSNVYYLIAQGAGTGDAARRLPITGNETVLDAIGPVLRLSQLSDAKVWVARLAPEGGPRQILPVDWDAIVDRGEARTNYRVLPGDWVFVAGPSPFAAACREGFAVAAAPFSRVAGVLGLGDSTVHYGSGRGQGRDAVGF